MLVRSLGHVRLIPHLPMAIFDDVRVDDCIDLKMKDLEGGNKGSEADCGVPHQPPPPFLSLGQFCGSLSLRAKIIRREREFSYSTGSCARIRERNGAEIAGGAVPHHTITIWERFAGCFRDKVSKFALFQDTSGQNQPKCFCFRLI